MGFVELVKSLIGKKGWDYAERRGKKRVKCRFQASIVHGSGMIGVEVKNISVKGLQLLCLGKVKKGTTIQLKGVKQYNQASVHELQCRIEWVKKDKGGWLAGLRFLDSPQDMSKSWLFWELKEQGVKMTAADTKRKAVRVRTNIPAKVSGKEKSRAKVTNMSPSGAMIQVLGEHLEEGQVVVLEFGPLQDLPRIAVRANVASLHVQGAPVYGLRFMTYTHGSEDDLKKYLNFFFKD